MNNLQSVHQRVSEDTIKSVLRGQEIPFPTQTDWVTAIAELKYLKRLGDLRDGDLNSFLFLIERYRDSDIIPLYSEIKALKHRVAIQREGQVLCLSRIVKYWMAVKASMEKNKTQA